MVSTVTNKTIEENKFVDHYNRKLGKHFCRELKTIV